MARIDISANQVPLAAEDKFAIVGIRGASQLCPSYEDGSAIRLALQHTKTFWQSLTPVFDLRGLGLYYNDVDEFVQGIAGRGAHVLVSDNDHDAIERLGLVERGCTVIKLHGSPLRAQRFDLKDFLGEQNPHSNSRNALPLRGAAEDLLLQADQRILEAAPFAEEDFDDEYESCLAATQFIESNPPTADELLDCLDEGVVADAICRSLGSIRGFSHADIAKSFRDLVPFLQRDLVNYSGTDDDDGMIRRDAFHEYLMAAYFHAFLRHIHKKSLLIEFAFSVEGDKISCVPYHSHSIHEIGMPGASDLIMGRPGIVAETTASVFKYEIREFEALLNQPKLRELDLQRFLEQHPSFLRGLNYKNIYSQLVLQRDDGTQLRPDFILEPFDDGWCDSLDLKLPRQKVIVGRRDRKTLASGIHEVVAQLREYAAYFEQEKYQKYVADKYGLRIYRPRLIALVGRDLFQMNSAQIRRVMTQYENCQILTFDQLIAHSRSRLLI